MSTRERWIVYPLLFLSLGAALRDKLLPPRELRAQRVVCERLDAAQSECGRLIVMGPNGRPVVEAGTDPASKSGAIAAFSPEGIPLVQLLSPSTGGVILLTGHVGHEFGVFAQLQELGLRIPITLPAWRYEGKPSATPPKGEKKSSSPAKHSADQAAGKAATNNKREATEPSAPRHP